MSTLHKNLMAFTLLIATLLTGCATPKTKPVVAEMVSKDLRVLSFNIRNGKANDGANRWDARKPLVTDVIREYDADIVGLQEAFRFQMDYLGKHLPAYGEIGEGRDGGTANEYCAILYKRDRFTVVASGTFWLSETPGVVSKHWGHFHHRICTWARLIDKTSGRAFYIYNTHFDHRSQLARINSAVLIAQRIADRETKDPVILTGDFNAGENNPAIRYLKGQDVGKGQGKASGKSPVVLADTFRVRYPNRKDVQTGNGGYKGGKSGAKIDYIFVTKELTTLKANIDQLPRNGRYPSDHYPVTATIRLPKK